MKTCKGCNKKKLRTEFYKLTGKQYKASWDCRDSLCKPCRIIYQTERRRQIKRQAIEFLGGICKDCKIDSKYQEIFDFHHLDPAKKDFSIGRNYRTFEVIKPELEKCVLLCSNCHRIRHASN